jgi:dipicolinate synthase subunit A
LILKPVRLFWRLIYYVQALPDFTTPETAEYNDISLVLMEQISFDPECKAAIIWRVKEGGNQVEQSFPIQVAVIGGDARQLAVADALTKLAAVVKVFGHPSSDLPAGVDYAATMKEALDGVDGIILPISGMNEAGKVRGYQVDQWLDFGSYFTSFTPGTLLLAGSLTPRWVEAGVRQGYIIIQYAEDDTIAVPNAIPTAEGAVQLAMEQLPITIHGSRVLVIGFGRVGSTVARTFNGLGAQVTVAARRPELLARAKNMGCNTVSHTAFTGLLAEMDIIINTVPARVLEADQLARLLPEVLIIDLASAPGGIDFEAAGALGRKVLFAPGLPGKVAPKTAGAILAKAIPELIRNALSNSPPTFPAEINR